MDLGYQIWGHVKAFSCLPVVGGKLYLGSMFFLDFGGMFETKTARSTPISLGEMTVSVRDTYWRYTFERTLIDSQSVDALRFQEMLNQLMGANLTSILSLKDSKVKFTFNGARIFEVYLGETPGKEMDLIAFSLPSGAEVIVNAHGHLEMGRIDSRRQSHWNSLKRF